MFVNRYKASSWHKSVLKELVFFLRFAFLYVANGFRVRTVLFYPEFPIFKTQINRVLLGTRYNITNNPNLAFDLAIAWEDNTRRPRYPFFEQLGPDRTVVNRDCVDISKRRVEEASLAVFGYGLFVDPTRHRGPCVCKHDDNGRHDKTVILQCPTASADPECVYQRLVETRFDEHHVYDMRLQICADRITGVLLRYRPVNSPFHGDVRVVSRAPDQVLSGPETDRVLALARQMGLDYGDIDAIRDGDDGRLYVVDVNNTPQQVAAGAKFSRADARRHRRRTRAALLQQFLEPAVRLKTAPVSSRPG